MQTQCIFKLMKGCFTGWKGSGSPVGLSSQHLIQVIKCLVNLFAAQFFDRADAKLSGTRSEKVGLAHDAHELFLRDHTITVAVSLVDHLLNLVVGHVLAELFGHTLKVLERDFAITFVVKKAESLEHLLLGVAVGHLLCHHVEELGVVNDTGAVLVDVGDHLLDLLTFGLEAECAHGDLELFLVDVAGTVGIEEVEGLLDLLLLFLSKLSALLGAGKGGLLVGLKIG